MVRKYFYLFCFLGLFVHSGFAQWHASQAETRYKIRTETSPTHKSAGYFIVLPDGGILPETASVSAFTAEGKALKCFVLWHSRANGLAVIMEQPGSFGEVYIYVTRSLSQNVWTPESGLTPSQILCVDFATANINVSKKLGKFGSVGPTVGFFHNEEHEKVAFTIKGDLGGRGPPVSFYLMTYLDNPKEGRVFVAPVLVESAQNFSGNTPYDQRRMQVFVDGSQIQPKRLVNKNFGVGEWKNMPAGLVRFDVFTILDSQVASAGDGTMYMCWRTPVDTTQDLSGIQERPLPPGEEMPKEAALASRPVRSREIARSGKASVTDVARRDGAPVAGFRMQAVANYWVGENAKPLFVYVLSAYTDGNPKDTEYTWEFADGGKLTGAQAARFFPGFAEYRVGLTAASGNKQSKSVVPFYSYSSVQSDMNDEKIRAYFRAAFLGMVKSFPVDVNPVAGWDQSMWRCFHEVQEFGKGSALLAEVLGERWKFFKGNMTLEQQIKLEDVYFQWIAHRDPDAAIKWLEGQASSSSDAERRKELRVRLAEVYMYQKDNLVEAEKIIKPLAQGAGGATSRAAIRLGDIAFLDGDLSMANQYWGAVQNRVNITKDMIDAGGGVRWQTQEEIELAEAESELGGRGQDPVLRQQMLERQRRKLQAEMDAREKFQTAIRGREKIDNWKKAAVLDTTMASSIVSLMRQGYWNEAYLELQRWEINFPLSKISGDYIIREADYYIKIGNRKRGRRLLEAYCKNVDASGYLPEAVTKLLDLMVEAKEPKESLIKFCEDMKKRFEFHPLAERMENRIILLKGGKLKDAVNMDELQW